MRWKATPVVLAIVLAACGFEKEQFLGDAAVPPPSVGFVQPTSLQDESSGAIVVPVRLKYTSTDPIAVNYRISGGTADLGTDYTAEAMGTLSFAPGQTEQGVPIEILIDSNDNEPDETIDLELSSPSGAELGLARHTITINSVMLPRVSFSTETSSDAEANDLVLTLVLTTPALMPSSVTVANKNTSTGAATFDWTMPATPTVNFPQGSMTQTLTIPIVNDTMDEDDETAVFELIGETNIIISSTVPNDHAHTIVDNDDPPTVSITSSATTMADEKNMGMSTNYTITVALSGPSGKPITVPVTYAGGTATENADYTYMAKADLAYLTSQNPAMCETSKTITISVTGDNTDEDDQTIVTTLGATPTNATLGAATTQTHTITDDDQAPTVSFTTGNTTTNEGDSGTLTVPYTLTLSSASEKAISLTVALSGSATYTDDYTTTPAPTSNNVTLSIAAGATTTTLDINIVGDLVRENANSGNETVGMMITMPLTNVRAGSNGQSRTQTIHDTDP